MTATAPVQGPLLPPVIFAAVLQKLPQQTLLNCRLLDRYHGTLATKEAFQHVRLVAVEDTKRFVHIARSERLRPHVREVTCDTRMGPEGICRYQTETDPPVTWQFLAGLPFLRYFTGLATLNLRFHTLCADDEGYCEGTGHVHETPDFRFRILDTVFQCLAGTWSFERQDEVDEDLDLPMLQGVAEETSEQELDFYIDGYGRSRTPAPAPMTINTLTICNLGDFDDPRLTESEEFLRVVNSGVVQDLRLRITFRMFEPSPEEEIYFPEKHDLLENLPATWLSPGLATNLRVLCLYCSDYWGWSPRMDFREVNPWTGNSSFPHLRVLALGSYVFSHEWQVDWIASLGRQNGRGGLEELYLSDCPIMAEARTLLPIYLDDTAHVIRNPRTGETLRITDDLYPRKDVMTRRGAFSRSYNVGTFRYPLRWHQVLSRWQAAMHGLKAFVIAPQTHGDIHRETGAGHIDRSISEFRADWERQRQHERRTTLHEHGQSLRHDPAEPRGREFTLIAPGASPHLQYGAGSHQGRRHQPEYVHFDIGLGPSPWIVKDSWWTTDESMEEVRDELMERFEAEIAGDSGALERLFQSLCR